LRRCFVISPIGQTGTVEREHADDVFDYIIKPAMEQCGIEVYRSDHMSETGKITDQMFRGILSEDLCIAVLTFNKPNVFYELAVAHSFKRPTIIMIERGQEIPFDIKDMRYIEYDLKPRSLFTQKYVKEIVNFVQDIDEAGWTFKSPFDEDDIPVNQRVRFLPQANKFGPSEKWIELLNSTQKVFDIMGVNLKSWRKTKGFRDYLNEKASEGCVIRVLITHENHPLVNNFADYSSPEISQDNIISDIHSIVHYFTDFPEKHPNIHFKQLKKGCMHIQMCRTDEQVTFIQYMQSQTPSYSPLWQFSRKANEHIYKLMSKEFNELWELNE
jgi:hypothetical protein